MKSNSQKTEIIHKNSHFLFIASKFHKLFIYLKSATIQFLAVMARFLVKKGDKKMRKNDQMMTYYKMPWIDYLCKNDVRSTIRHGFILYLVIAMLAVPSALCSQQHRVITFKIPTLDLLTDISAIPSICQVESQDTELDNMVAQLPALDATAALKVAPPFFKHIMQAAEAYDVDPALIRAVIVAESSYNPQAVSKRGAQGLMQLMPTTARALGVADSFNPAMNIDGGARYLRQLLDRFDGVVRLALAAYNAGSRYVRKYKGVPPFKATRLYIKKVLKYQEKFQAEMATDTDSPV